MSTLQFEATTRQSTQLALASLACSRSLCNRQLLAAYRWSLSSRTAIQVTCYPPSRGPPELSELVFSLTQAQTGPSTTAYSITSSARASSNAGTLRPSAFAVLKLITSSNFVGCCTGMSMGLPPLSTLAV